MISFEGGWCASKTDALFELGAISSIAKAAAQLPHSKSFRFPRQIVQDSACFWDRAVASPLSLMRVHPPPFPKRRTPASCLDDGAQQKNHAGLAIRRAASEAPPAARRRFLPYESHRVQLRTSSLSIGAYGLLPIVPPVPLCAPGLPARC